MNVICCSVHQFRRWQFMKRPLPLLFCIGGQQREWHALDLDQRVGHVLGGHVAHGPDIGLPGRDIVTVKRPAEMTVVVAELVTDEVDLDESPARSCPVRPLRIGIWDFSSDPGLVCERPLSSIRARSFASRRSIVADDTAHSGGQVV
jgi:hypothetical protein